MDSFLNDQRIAKILNTPPVPPETPDWLKKEIAQKEESAASRRSKDTSGSLGKNQPVPKNGALAIHGTSKELQLAAKTSAIEAAKTAGVLGAIASSSAFAAISGGTTALGGAATDALGGLLATEAGDAFGSGGVGILNAGALRRWEFPKPQGGIVVVSYPFVLKAAE